ncbi:MAG: hypothetical protein ACYC7D_01450 [Nitrososphaerales archaeon]
MGAINKSLAIYPHFSELFEFSIPHPQQLPIQLLNYGKIARVPSIFRSFTGLGVVEFDSVYEKVRSKINEFEKRRL